jgi:hypothetical protein
MDKGLNWKDGTVINQSIISITKQPELPKVESPAAPQASAEQKAPAQAPVQ